MDLSKRNSSELFSYWKPRKNVLKLTKQSFADVLQNRCSKNLQTSQENT